MFTQLIKELDICVPKKPRSEWGKCQRRIVDRVISAIKNPYEGMTNGEVIQTLFPEVKVEIDGFLVRCIFIEHEFTTTMEWWNKTYQKEVNDG